MGKTYMENTTTVIKVVKTTKRDYYAMLKDIVKAVDSDKRDDLLKFINHEVELLDKKSSKGGKASEETTKRMDIVFDCLSACTEPVTITELQKAFPEELADFSNQRISALLRKMDDRVVKTVKGKVSRFSVAVAETVEETAEAVEEINETTEEIAEIVED